MILKHNYFCFRKAIPLKTCKKILKAGRKKIIEEATTFAGIDKVKRDCKVAWIEDAWIYDILNPFIHTANKQAGWNFQWDWNETSQFTIYEKGLSANAANPNSMVVVYLKFCVTFVFAIMLFHPNLLFLRSTYKVYHHQDKH